MKRRKCALLAVLCVCILSLTGFSQERIRIASYNIRFLKASVVGRGDRTGKLREIIRLLDARIIGLQEIGNRQALELIFSPSDWQIVIDDDSRSQQNLALAVKKPLKVLGINPDLDADDDDFLFPDKADDSPFPERRDVLAVEVQLPDQSESFFVMVVHAKSRSGGREATDHRRVEAAQMVVEKLKSRFSSRNFVLLGDFNDTPDDRSLNILETGDPLAPAKEEEADGPFMANLMEPLLAAGHVTGGRTGADVLGNRVNTIDPASRRRNNDHRGSNLNTGDALFDQILIPLRMRNRYVGCSAKVFDHEIAVRGTGFDVASDHLPVFADFVFGAEAGQICTPVPDKLRIVALLPNPAGADAGREEVVLKNGSSNEINLRGWKLRDRAGNVYPLSGIVPAGARLRILMTGDTMPLNNSGDEVSLITPQGASIHTVTYVATQVNAGEEIAFP